MKLDWQHSFRCCQIRDDTPSSFDIEVGIMMESWSCCKAATLRSAFPTMRMHRHLGRQRPSMSTSADMVLGGAIEEVTAARHWLGGRQRSTAGRANIERFSFISTMIKRRLRRRMLSASAGSHRVRATRARQFTFLALPGAANLGESLSRHYVRCRRLQLVLPAADHAAFANHHRLESIFRDRPI